MAAASRVSNRVLLCVAVVSCALGPWMGTAAAQEEETPAVPSAEEAADGETGGGALAQAEAAYLDIDFERVRDLAGQALQEGGHSPVELVRIYKLIGMAQAALGNQEEAHRAFVRMLMLSPNEEITELSPELRGPYLEAKGRVNALSQRFAVEVALSRPMSALVVRLSDPIHMASRVVIHARPGGEGEFVEQTAEPAARITQELEGVDDLGWAEYWIEVQDEHGNLLAASGTSQVPATVGEPIRRVSDDDDRTVWQSPWLWTGIIAVLAGAGLGSYFLVRDTSHDGRSGICFQCPN